MYIINIINIINQSFIENAPSKPPIQKGYLRKLNYFRFIEYKRFFVLDPDSGTFTRYKSEVDYPFKPIEILSISNVKDVSLLTGEWYMTDTQQYINIVYMQNQNKSNNLLVSSHSKETISHWLIALKSTINYCQFIDSKLSSYSQQGKNNQLSECLSQLFDKPEDIQIIRDSVNLDANTNYINNNNNNNNNNKSTKTIPRIDLSNQKEEKRQGFDSPQQNQIMSPESPRMRLSLEGDDSQLSIRSNDKRVTKYLKQYQFIKMIGQGSFGKVYLVQHLKTSKVYAMKQLSKAKLISKKQIKYAVTECNVLKAVCSPYIINLYQSFQTPSHLYLVMDYCSGGDLALHLSRQRTFSENLTRLVMKELVTAIEYLHSLEFIYRDLKPENVLLDKSGHIKLVDFGLSKQMIQGAKAKSFCGSPAYLAPEILLGKGATKATDVYGLGALMFELVTGDPPFFDDDLQLLYRNIKTAPLKIPQFLSAPCRQLLNGLLQREPSKRIGCKQQNQVNWNEIKSSEFFGDWDKLKGKIMLSEQEDLDWLSEDEDEDNRYNVKILFYINMIIRGEQQILIMMKGI